MNGIQRFDPDDWFQIDAKARKYLRTLLLAEMGIHDYGSDEYRRASRMNVMLIDRDPEP